MKNLLKNPLNYILTFLKWSILSIIVGCLGGVIGSVFHISIDYVTELRVEYGYVLYFLPVGGLVITLLYSISKKFGKLDTNRVIEAVKTDNAVPFIMSPLIFISTVITHFFGGSAGREGAALQLGGSIGSTIGKIVKLNNRDKHIIVMAGMSGVFSALFGTPLTATVFALEVTTVGIMYYSALIPCFVSSWVAFQIALGFKIPPVRFLSVVIPEVSVLLVLKVAALALLCGIICILFCKTIKFFEHYMHKFLPNKYLRTFIGGSIIVGATLLLGSTDYNGAGMGVITNALDGKALPEAFVLKLLFTAVTISAGFKGGEIVPSFFIGATFGCVVGSLLGIPAGFAASIGFICLFCGVVNCPIASVILSIEVFGAQGLMFFALSCFISYLFSGYSGLYSSQKIMYSKLDATYINKTTI